MSSTSAESAVMASTGFDESSFETFLSTRNEPAWWTESRRRAFALYQEKLATELDPEEFKRVDLRTFRPEKFSLQPTGAAAENFDTLFKDRAEFAGQVAHVDGSCVQQDLAKPLADAGVLFGDLATIAREHPQVVEKFLQTRGVQAATDRFSAWHAAFCTGGTLLYVPRGVEIDLPLYSRIALSADGAADFSHTLIVLEEGAKATLLEETASVNADSSGLHVGAVELLVADGAQLRYVQLQNWNENVWHLAHQAARVERDASLQWTVGSIGARLTHIHQDVALDGPGAEAEVNGVTFTTNRQRTSYYTKQSHNAPNTRSDLLYKQVLKDHSRVVWRGMIRVEPEAQKTDGYQRCDALLLNPTCRNDAIPGLEIEADDVRCTHGATAGRVDEEQILYCMCRGLTHTEARHMIVEGFFRTVYDRIPVEVVRETLSRAIEKKLGIGD